jgi:hypothetical protein
MMIDEIRRRCVLDEWITEIRTVKGLIEHDSLEQTDLAPLRRTLLADLDCLIDFADSHVRSDERTSTRYH